MVEMAPALVSRFQAAVCYSLTQRRLGGPIFNLDYYVNFARRCEEMGADSVVLKDMAGMCSPNDAYAIIKGMKETIKIPVQFHTHYTSGSGSKSYLKAIEAGVDVLDTCLSPFALRTSQPAIEPLLVAVEQTDRETDMDLAALIEIGYDLEKVAVKYRDLLDTSKIAQIDTGVLLHQIPSGMHSNLVNQLKELNALDRMHEVMEELPNTRRELGYPPLVTPTSQIVGIQGVMNVLFGRYNKVAALKRVYDFLNHVPNMVTVFEEVQKAGRLLMPSICFSTGKEHTDDFYVGKVKEILEVTGPDVIVSIKNFAGLGTPKRIGQLVEAIREAFPETVLHYHGCNTDGNDIGRMSAAILAGAKICDVADHGYGSIYGQAPALTLIQNLRDYGKKAEGVNIKALLQSSDVLRRERKIYEPFESPFRGHDPTAAHYKLTGGAVGSAYEHADKGGFLERMPEVFQEMARVQLELGNWWSVTPGSQILWTTAVNNVFHGRYERPSNDLKNLLLERYGPTILLNF